MRDRFPRKFDVQTSYKPSNYVLALIFVVNSKFPRATCHTIVPFDRRTLLFKQDDREKLYDPLKNKVRLRGKKYYTDKGKCE